MLRWLARRLCRVRRGRSSPFLGATDESLLREEFRTIVYVEYGSDTVLTDAKCIAPQGVAPKKLSAEDECIWIDRGLNRTPQSEPDLREAMIEVRRSGDEFCETQVARLAHSTRNASIIAAESLVIRSSGGEYTVTAPVSKCDIHCATVSPAVRKAVSIV